MLRWTVALLVVANLAFFAWTHGWLNAVVGVSPQGDRDPQRLLQQVHPERVEVLSPEAASAATAASPAASGAEPAGAASGSVTGAAATPALACVEAGPYAPADLRSVQAALSQAGVPAGRVQTVPVQQPAVWLVYMGRFTDPAVLQRKEEELQRIHVGFQELHGAASLEPGLSLGRFGDRAAADDALARLTQRGVHTARVAELPAPSPLRLVRLQDVEPPLAAQLQSLKWPVSGPGLQGCSTGAVTPTGAPRPPIAAAAPAGAFKGAAAGPGQRGAASASAAGLG